MAEYTMEEIEEAKNHNKPGLPVKMLPDASVCNQCISEALEYDIVNDCEACKNVRYRYGYLMDIKHGFLTTTGVVLFEDGEIASVPIHRLRGIDVPKISK